MSKLAAAHDFTGKVVVITGGSRGIGHAMALGFAGAGANLAIASRKLDSCEATVREIKAIGRDASAHAIHVGKWADCDRLAEEVYARWGRADVLINNAGLSPLAPSPLETSEELFDKVISVDLKGAFRLSALFGSLMAAGGGGAIINISALAAIRPTPEVGPYAAAKAGLNALTIAFAMEYGPKVRVNCIMCGALSYRHQQSMVAQGRLYPAREENLSTPARRRTRGGGGRRDVLREPGFELH